MLVPGIRARWRASDPAVMKRKTGHQAPFIIVFSGGESGIRTHEHLAMLLDFQSSAFDRSAISPARG